ncbi:hypothetical protein [Acidiphilium rubrum]|uniref:hypothetical protein n=2 Tax=Acidiphilium TaxID=522 RepID=UPI001C3799C8|nr:hypothetical protein [Acidiphilium rubrum]
MLQPCEQVGVGKGSSAFLKKNSKKLLLVLATGVFARTALTNKSFFASFFTKKEELAAFHV